jgi:iron complex outermembrane receptor protein
LTEATLEDLMNMEVTSVSKKEQRLSQAPAAIFVITQEDIRRSGMTTMADLMRLVPGADVGQIQGGAWAVSARGFNDNYSNKLLVLVDGRSVYSPTHAGVNWEAQDTLFNNIDRIEVIRGPGATLWGANAVNGVINIITKPASETQGAFVIAGVGDQGQALGGARFGGEIGKIGHYRAFTKYLHGRGLENSDGLSVLSGEISTMGGFRADLTLSPDDSLTLEGDALRAHSDSEVTSFSLTPPFANRHVGEVRNQSADLMATWSRRQSDRSKTTLRASLDAFVTEEPNLNRSYRNIDLDFQHQLTVSESDEIVWGLGFRDSTSHGSQGFSASLKSRAHDLLYSGFIQDQHILRRDRLSLVVGTKFEHNEFTGVEIQPEARLLWTPTSRQTLWVAVSRAVRTPATIDYGLTVNVVVPGPSPAPIVIRQIGVPTFGSEDVVAYELGHRLQTRRRYSIDVATFHNVYSHLTTHEPGAPDFEQSPQPAHLVIPQYWTNGMHGQSNGLEVSSNLNVTDRWRLIPGYSALWLDMRLNPDSHDHAGEGIERASPRHQFQFRSNLDLTRKLQFDTALYTVSALPSLPVDAYARLDARLGYKLGSGAEISVSGQNLQGGRHVEYLSVGPYSKASIGRSFIVKLSWSL